MQTRIRLVAPLIVARTDCRFGSKRRGPTLWAWEIVRPTTGPLPQILHRLAMISFTDSPVAARRKLQIVVDGYGMINEGAAGVDCLVARLRWSSRAMSVR